jgi:prevent-host-death family protein
MKQVNVHEAKTHFSKLLDEAAAGEEIIIAKSGHPIVRLVPVLQSSPVVLGSLKGKITIPDNFDDDLPDDVINGFYGGSA